MANWIELLVWQLERGGVDLVGVGLGWARAAPIVAIVPAFGLRALPGPVRAMLGLSLAACVGPAVAADPALASASPASALAMSFAQGLPIAIAAAIPLWAATMAGGVVDAVRGTTDLVWMPPVEGRATPVGVLLALLASALFLSNGGPAQVAGAMATPIASSLHHAPLLGAALNIAAGVQIALSIAAPVLAAAIVIEIGGALVARASSPAQIHALLAPIRSAAILAIVALVLERMVSFAAVFVRVRV